MLKLRGGNVQFSVIFSLPLDRLDVFHNRVQSGDGVRRDSGSLSTCCRGLNNALPPAHSVRAASLPMV